QIPPPQPTFRSSADNWLTIGRTSKGASAPFFLYEPGFDPWTGNHEWMVFTSPRTVSFVDLPPSVSNHRLEATSHGPARLAERTASVLTLAQVGVVLPVEPCLCHRSNTLHARPARPRLRYTLAPLGEALRYHAVRRKARATRAGRCAGLQPCVPRTDSPCCGSRELGHVKNRRCPAGRFHQRPLPYGVVFSRPRLSSPW